MLRFFCKGLLGMGYGLEASGMQKLLEAVLQLRGEAGQRQIHRYMHRYMHRHNVKKEQIALVSVKNKRNALNHPCAQLAANITVEDVLNSEIMCWPVQRLDVSPTSDGAAAVVLASQYVAKEVTDNPVWIDGVGWCIDSTHWTNRDVC